MKRLILAVILCVTCVAVGLRPNSGDYNLTSATRKQPYELEINSVDANDTPLTDDTKYWDVIQPGGTGEFPHLPAVWSVVELAFYGYGDGTGTGDPTGATFSFKVFAARQYGNARLIYQGTGEFGELAMSVDPTDGTQLNSGAVSDNYHWADTITPAGIGADWITNIQLSGHQGTDDLATISIDVNGHWLLWVEITDMDVAVTTIVCVASGYSP